jgi:hypothetical protein
MTKQSDLNLSERIGPSGRPLLGLKAFAKPNPAKPAATLTEAVGTVPKPVIKRPPPKRVAKAPQPAKSSSTENCAATTTIVTPVTTEPTNQTSPARARRLARTPEEHAKRMARLAAERAAWATMTPEEQAVERARRDERDQRWLARLTEGERVAELNRRSRDLQRHAVRVWSRQQWPAVFSRRENALPLAIGIREQIIAAAREQALPIGEDAIKAFLRWWCSSLGYLAAAAAEGSKRHALDGRPIEDVSDEARRMAAADHERLQQQLSSAQNVEAANV